MDLGETINQSTICEWEVVKWGELKKSPSSFMLRTYTLERMEVQILLHMVLALMSHSESE